MVYYGISHLSLVFSSYTHSPTEKIQVTRGIFHSIPLESVASLVYICVIAYTEIINLNISRNHFVFDPIFFLDIGSRRRCLDRAD